MKEKQYRMKVKKALEITLEDNFEQTSYDFNIAVGPGNELEICFSYNSSIYDGELVKTIEGHMKRVIEGIIQNPDIRLADIDILSEEERREILYDFNNTQAEYPKDKTIHQLFEEQVERTPDNIAVVFRR